MKRLFIIVLVPVLLFGQSSRKVQWYANKDSTFIPGIARPIIAGLTDSLRNKPTRDELTSALSEKLNTADYLPVDTNAFAKKQYVEQAIDHAIVATGPFDVDNDGDLTPSLFIREDLYWQYDENGDICPRSGGLP